MTQPSELEKKLSELLIQVSEVERKVEITRQILGETKNFDPCQVFWRIDRRSQNEISKIDLNIFLLENDISLSKTQLNLLFSSLDYNDDSVIDWNEFLKATVTIKREYYEEGKNEKKLSEEVEMNSVRVFKEELDGVSRLMSNVKRLLKCKDFDSKKCFDLIDKEKKGFFTAKEVHEYVSLVHGKSTSKRAARVIKRLDRDGDGKIIFKEFEKLFKMYDNIRKKRSEEENMFLSPITTVSQVMTKMSSPVYGSNKEVRVPEKKGKKEEIKKFNERRNTVAVVRKKDSPYKNPEKLGIYGYDTQKSPKTPVVRTETKSNLLEDTLKHESHKKKIGKLGSSEKAYSKILETSKRLKSPEKEEKTPICSFLAAEKTLKEDGKKRDVTPDQGRKSSHSKPPKSPIEPSVRNDKYTRMLMATLNKEKEMKKEYYPMRKREGKYRNKDPGTYKANPRRFNEIKNYKNKTRERSRKKSTDKKMEDIKVYRDSSSKKKEKERNNYPRRNPVKSKENHHVYRRKRFTERSRSRDDLYSSPASRNMGSRKHSLADVRYSRNKNFNEKYDIGVKESSIISPIDRTKTEFTLSHIGLENSRGSPEKQKAGYINETEKRELIKSINAIVDNHRMLEEQKKVLAMRRDFVPIEAFSIFNDFQRDHLTIEDIKNLLRSLKVSMNSHDAGNLIKSYDDDNDNILNFKEFKNLILPKSRKYLAKIDKKEPCDIESFEDYSIKTRKSIRDVFNCLVKTERMIEFESDLIKENLGKLILDISNNGVKYQKCKIDTDDIGDVLAECGLDVTYRELRSVLGKFGI